MFNRISVSPSQELRIILLGSYGFYGRVIADRVRATTGEKFSVGTIYRVLRQNGVKLSDYRKGLGMEARDVMTSTNRVIAESHSNAGHDETVKKLRKRFKAQQKRREKKEEDAIKNQSKNKTVKLKVIAA